MKEREKNIRHIPLCFWKLKNTVFKAAKILFWIHWLGYGLDDLRIMVQLRLQPKDFYFLYTIQTGNGVQSAY